VVAFLIFLDGVDDSDLTAFAPLVVFAVAATLRERGMSSSLDSAFLMPFAWFRFPFAAGLAAAALPAGAAFAAAFFFDAAALSLARIAFASFAAFCSISIFSFASCLRIGTSESDSSSATFFAAAALCVEIRRRLLCARSQSTLLI
jgi:hypothetical protein